MKAFGHWFTLIKFHIVAAMGNGRWRFVPFVYLLTLLSFIADKRHNPWERMPLGSDANVVDVSLWFLSNVFRDGFLLLLGFMLLVGDDMARGYHDGTLRLSLLLGRSTKRWWISRVLALGVLAFAYMGIVQLATVVASLVMGVSMGLGNSGASVRIRDMTNPWYYQPAGWSTLGYNAFSVFSLAFTMWVVVVIHQVASLWVFPDRRIPFFVFFAWLLLGFVVQTTGAWWDLRFLLYPGKCFAEFGHGATSIPVFFGVLFAALVVATVLGYRKWQRVDL